MSAVDGLFIILSGAAAAGDELVVVSADVVPDDGAGEALDGVLAGALDVDDGVLGLIDDVLGLIAELDGVALVLLGVDDDDELDGDGATTGGVVDFAGGGASRWQPTTPSAMPAHSSEAKAGFVMGISDGLTMRIGFSRFGAISPAFYDLNALDFPVEKQQRRCLTPRKTVWSREEFAHVGHPNFIGRR